MDWYYAENGERKGPLDLEAIRTLVREGRIKPTDHVWNATLGERWAQASEFPVLGAVGRIADDPKIKAETERRMKERREAEARAKTAFRIRFAIGLAVLAAAVWGIAYLVRTQEARRWGVASSRPLGRLETLEAHLVNDLLMEKSDAESCAAAIPPGGRATRYDKPKVPKGEHVTTKGGVTLVVAADGSLHGVMADFPSSGMRGPTIIDKSLVQIFMNDYWRAFYGNQERAFMDTRKMPEDIRAETGLVARPDGTAAAFRRGGVVGVWIEYGTDYGNTLVYIHRTDLAK